MDKPVLWRVVRMEKSIGAPVTMAVFATEGLANAFVRLGNLLGENFQSMPTDGIDELIWDDALRGFPGLEE
jgi:hypothetical protein